MTSFRFRFALGAGLVLWAGLGQAAGSKGGDPPVPPLAAAPVTPVLAGPAAGAPDAPKLPAPQNETQQYCSNIAAAAADARFAWQRKQLTDLQAQLKQRVADLEAKEAEFKVVMAQREEMTKKATDTVVGLYAHMKPEAAAAQLAALDDPLAAAILAQLSQRQASSILNEIPADKAAKLVAVIGTVAEKKS